MAMEPYSRIGFVAFSVVAIVGAAVLYGPISNGLDKASAFVLGANDSYISDWWSEPVSTTDSYDWESSDAWNQPDPYTASTTVVEITEESPVPAANSFFEQSSWWNSVQDWWTTSWDLF